MKRNLKSSLSTKKTILLLTIASILLGGFSFIVGGLSDFILPGLIAVLAALYVFDQNGRISMIASIILVVLNIGGFVIGINYTAFGIFAVIGAMLISGAYTRGQSKSDAAFSITIISVILTVCTMLLSAMIELNDFSIDAAVNFYVDYYKSIRQYYSETAMESYSLLKELLPELYSMLEQEFTLADFADAFDYNFKSNIIAMVVVSAFALVGFSMKIFGFIVGKCSEDKTYIRQWRFAMSTPYALFYVLLGIACVFTGLSENIFAFSVSNLYTIFLTVFAYAGFKALVELLGKKMHIALSFLIVSAASLMLAAASLPMMLVSFVPQILATVGVLFTIRYNRRLLSENN